ncbi:mucin-3A-like [Grus americana]|uniref:mucin-3A-like n=1 Tax=Grus americana TaxID=9117 RepID=UPI002407942B|nr:mucin-3A-like [Grus americana]
MATGTPITSMTSAMVMRNPSNIIAMATRTPITIITLMIAMAMRNTTTTTITTMRVTMATRTPITIVITMTPPAITMAMRKTPATIIPMTMMKAKPCTPIAIAMRTPTITMVMKDITMVTTPMTMGTPQAQRRRRRMVTGTPLRRMKGARRKRRKRRMRLKGNTSLAPSAVTAPSASTASSAPAVPVPRVTLVTTVPTARAASSATCVPSCVTPPASPGASWMSFRGLYSSRLQASLRHRRLEWIWGGLGAPPHTHFADTHTPQLISPLPNLGGGGGLEIKGLKYWWWDASSITSGHLERGGGVCES